MKTIAEYANMKNKFFHAAKKEPSPKKKAEFLKAFDSCDKMIYLIGQAPKKKPLFTRARLTVMAGIALFLIIVYCSGCGKMLGGAGQMLDGFGDGVSYVGQHIQEAVKE